MTNVVVGNTKSNDNHKLIIIFIILNISHIVIDNVAQSDHIHIESDIDMDIPIQNS